VTEEEKIGDLNTHLFFFCGLSILGFPFLLWFSSFYIWFISVLVALSFALISLLLEKNDILYYEKIEIGADIHNPFMSLAIVLSAMIYFSAPFTDNQTYCEKQIETSFTPTLSYEGGKYGVSDKMSTYSGSAGCAPGTVNLILFLVYLGLTFWYFVKTLIMFFRYFFSKE
jgi:hypothetical protein